MELALQNTRRQMSCFILARQFCRRATKKEQKTTSSLDSALSTVRLNHNAYSNNGMQDYGSPQDDERCQTLTLLLHQAIPFAL